MAASRKPRMAPLPADEIGKEVVAVAVGGVHRIVEAERLAAAAEAEEIADPVAEVDVATGTLCLK